jgi:hypothetical protein
MAAGDVAVVGFSADAKSFAFVLLTDLSGTTINFTDNGWQSSGSFRPGEGIITLTIPAGTPIGTVITVSNTNTASAAAVTAGGTSIPVTRSGTLDFAQGGDTIFAYTGTAASPDFLFGIDFADSNTTYAGNATSTTTSGIPPALTEGSTALAFGADNGGYSGSLTGSRATILANIANAANWTFNEAAPVPTYPGNFTVTADGVETQTVVFNPTSVTQAEGDSGATLYTFTVARMGGTTGDLTFSGTISPGTTDAADFTGGVVPTTFSGVILAGQTSATVTVSIAGDVVIEGNESFQLTLTSVDNKSVAAPSIGANATATGNITNDDTPSLSITDVTQSEGNAGTVTYTFTVNLSKAAPSGGVTFDIATADGSGTAGSDYVARSLTGQTIAQGQTSYTFDVTVNGDTTFEPNEVFLVNVTSVSGATVGDGQGTGTITNDDAAPVGAFAIDDVSLSEGNSGSTPFTFTVTRTGGSAGAATVDYEIVALGGSGVANSADFVAGTVFTGTLSFADGETSKTITRNVQGDTTPEPNETFAVNLSNATGGATISDSSGTGTINNDDGLPPAGSVTIADASIVEGNSGTSSLVLTLTRSGGAAAFTVDYATANGGNPNNASATAGSDYAAQSGTVSFGEGEDVKTISITINGDTAFELSEEFKVVLSNANNGATIGDSTAIATITNDDSAPTTVRIFDEDFTGFTAAGFAPNPTATQIDSDIWRVVGLSDIANPPYGFTATTDDFARGTIGTNDPTSAGVYSPASNPALILQPTGSEIENGGFIEARIQNSSGSTATGFNIVFDWSYRNSADRSSNLQFSYSTDGTNFTPVSDAALVTPTTAGAATGTFTLQNEIVSLTGLNVPDQGFVYFRWTHLSSAGGGSRDEFGIDNVVVDATVTGPPPLAVSVSDVSVNEAAGTMTFTVTRSTAVSGAFTVDYATADGTATAGQDYTATFGTLSFTDNQVSATVIVPITQDSLAEFDETILLDLSSPSGGATITDRQGVGTILNDDGPPISVSIGDVTVAEGQSGTTTATFTVTRTGGTGAFTIDYSTADQTAVAPGDYAPATGTLSFAEGQNSQTFTVTVNGDTVSEGAETFQVLLSNGTGGAMIADGVGIGTIATDDPTYIHSIQGTSYYSPILAAEGKNGFNMASTTTVIIRAVVTAVDSEGDRQGFYVTEELADWDSNPLTSEGIFVMTRNDAGTGTLVNSAAPNIQIGDIVTFTAQVMEYQSFQTMPRTVLVNMTGFARDGTSAVPTLTLDASRPIPNSILTGVTPNYTDSSDDAGDTFDASLYALSFWETVEGMLVTIPDMVVADGFVQTVGTANDPVFQAYSRVHADADQINSRGGYTVAGDPPLSPPDTADTEDGTIQGGRHVHDGDTNPDIIELDFTDFAMSYPAGLIGNMSMGDGLGDVTGIVEFDFTDRKLFVTGMNPASYVDTVPARETTALGNDDRALTIATFNVENLDPTDGAERFAALAGVIANNMNSPDIIIIEEMQDNNGGRESSDPPEKGVGDGTSPTGTDASLSWQMLVDALNAAVPGANYQWVDEAPAYNSEGGQNNGNIRVGFLYDTNRVQLGDLAPDATIAERRQFTDRIGDGVRDAGDRIQFSDDLIAGEINTADWAGTRKSLLGQFTFHGQTVFVAANHFPAKSGSGSYWQLNQNLEAGHPVNSDFVRRNNVSNDLYTMLDHIERNAPGAGVVSGGDYNDFYFYRPLEVATGYVLPDGTARSGGSRFDNLTVTELVEAERYSYTFDGRSQTLDHIIVDPMLSGVAQYDVVHVNTGYSSLGTGANSSPRLSDHDPAVASFDFRSLSETFDGTAGDDRILLHEGGDDNVRGLGGNDVFYMGGAMTSADTIDGGEGQVDVISLQGDYSAGLSFANVRGVEIVTLLPGDNSVFVPAPGTLFSYVITVTDATVAEGAGLKVNGATLREGENFTFNGSQETNGTFYLMGGFGTDRLTGGQQADIFMFAEPTRFAQGDKVDGQGGYDNLVFRGNYSIDFNAPGYQDAFTGIESLTLASGTDKRFGSPLAGEADYSIVWDDDLLATGETFTVNGGFLADNETMDFNGSSEGGGHFRLVGGRADDVLRGGGGDDLIYGNTGSDTMSGGGGADVFRYDSAEDSTINGRDGIQDFSNLDLIDLTRVDANINTAANDSFTWIGSNMFTGQAGQLRATANGNIWTVSGDTDGNGQADFEFTVTTVGGHIIGADDFLL